MQLEINFNFYIIIGAILLVVLLFVLFMIISKFVNRKSLSSYIYRRRNNYVIRINKNDNKVSIYNRDKATNHSYDMEMFYSFIDPKDIKQFKEYIEDIELNSNKQNTSIIVNVKYNYEFTILIKYLDFNNNTIFLSASDIDNKTRKLIEKSNNVEVKNIGLMKKDIKKNKRSNYSICCVNFNLYNTILNRYGLEACNQFVKQTYILIQSILKSNEYVYYDNLDYFYIISFKRSSRINLNKYGKYIKDCLTINMFVYV